MSSTGRLSAAPRLRHRAESFGSFLWTSDRKSYYRLDGIDSLLFELFAAGHEAELSGNEQAAIIGSGFASSPSELRIHLRALCDAGLLLPASLAMPHTLAIDIDHFLKSFARERQILPTTKPVWVHLQPFTFCNLECLHCYCNSSPSSPRLRLTVDQWNTIIGRLDHYGIADIYITGGETLIVPETWHLLEQISKRGMGSGLSTNGLHLDDNILENLEKYKINRLQVSLDGGYPETHDYLRNRPGAFLKTIANIKRFSTVTEPVINTVVSRKNLDELSAIVSLGKSIGVTRYKFFPQKSCGRGSLAPNEILNDFEIMNVLVPTCQELSIAEAVEVETINIEQACGSARSGFAVDEIGDVYPCIFGILDQAQLAGNLLSGEVDEIWFHSTAMKAARSVDKRPCHSCES